MLKFARATLFAVVAVVTFVVGPVPTIPAAQAHVGSSPHVGTAWYKPWDDLGFVIGDGVGDYWKFRAFALDEFDTKLGAKPDMHEVNSCNEHPNWACIVVNEVNNPDVSWATWRDPDGPDGTNRTGIIKLNTANATGEGRHWSCRVVAFILGLHEHTGPNGSGCTESNADGVTIDTSRIHIGEAPMDAIRDAYQRG